MANTPNENLMSELASQMISQIGSFFERINASPSRPIGSFTGETAQNFLYVLYSANGLPLFAGAVLASGGKRGEARAQKEVQALAGSGYVASYRTVEFGSENMAMQMERLVSDLFGAALPLSAGRGHGAIDSAAAPARRPGRPPRSAAAQQTSGKRRGRPRKNAAVDGAAAATTAPRRRGRPRKNEVAGEATAPRRRGRPRKSESAVALPARRPGRPRKSETGAAEGAPARRPGRPRKVQSEEAAAAPRRRGRPRKEEGAPTRTRRTAGGTTGSTKGRAARGGRKGTGGAEESGGEAS